MSARIPCAFRVWPDGSVIALFPTLTESGGIQSFMHVGQHAPALPKLLSELRIATHAEALPLRKELEAAPYKYRLTYYRDLIAEEACVNLTTPD